MTNRTVKVIQLYYYNEEWYCIETDAGCSIKDMSEIYEHCKGVGDKIHCINNVLYFDKNAFFNIDLMFNNYDFITN